MANFEEIDSFNAYADFWFYTIGANIIPSDTINKTTNFQWSEYQNKPMPPELFEKRKRDGLYENGIALIPGKVWRGPNKDKYLVFIDLDNQKAIDEVCSCFGVRDLEDLSQYIIVERHKGNLSKAHLYFYSDYEFKKKSSDVAKQGDKIKNNEIPAIEVKGTGEHGIAFCSPSLHQDGTRYEIIGTKEPKTCGKEVEDLLLEIYKKYNLGINKDNQKVSIEKLFEKDFVIFEGHNRHEGLLRAMESFISRTKKILSEEKIKKLAIEWNQEHCKPPLDDKNFEKQWLCAKKFIEKNNNDNNIPLETREAEVPLEPPNSVSTLLNSIKERYIEIFIDQLNRFYIILRINDHTECIPLESNRFKNLIRMEYFDREKNVISGEKLDNVIKLIEAQSMFNVDLKKIDLSLRVAKTDDDVFYYDLTNQEWEIIKIKPSGWEMVKNDEIPIFKRYENNCSPQVYPSKDYKKGIFDKFLKLFNLKSKNDVLLLSVYIISLFIPEIPKVILVVSGDGGGAKTTTLNLIKKIVDPNVADTFSFPKQINDLIQTLDHQYVNFFDNVSFVSQEVSDLLCRAVTGSGNNKRALYQDDVDFIYKFKRCIGVNGINLATTRADFLDRSLVIKLKRIDPVLRRKEEEINEEFESLKPFVLGYIFDLLVKVLKYRGDHNGEKILIGYPRMADFAEWCEIISRCMGYKDNEFIDAYHENINNQNDEVIESSPVAEVLLLFMNERDQEYWEGTPTELHKKLTDVVDLIKPDIKRSNLWPKASSKLTCKINEIIPNLKEKDIEIVTGERDNKGDRVIKIRKLQRQKDDEKKIDSSNGLFNPNIHRLGYSDTFECDRCVQRGDIHFMKQHLCKGN